jgi:hypothetical protein
MGAVKEVVTTLERCPVSVGDLKDLKVGYGSSSALQTLPEWA